MKIYDVVPATNWMQQSQARINHAMIGLTVRKKIPVKSEVTCGNCRKKFLARPFEWYCSDYCDGAAQAAEDRARD